MKEVVILGGLGNGSVIAAAIDDARHRGNQSWRVAGYLNDRLPRGTDLEGHTVLGSLGDVGRELEAGRFFINAIYRIDGQGYRIALFEGLGIPDERLATFVHPTAYVAPNVSFGGGCVVMPHVCISPGTEFGRCCLVMVGATIGHNNRISDHCHFAAQCCVGANLVIGRGAHVGLNACIREELTLGECSTVGMGSVLLKNTGAFEVWAGVPARCLRRAEEAGGE